MTVSSQAWDAFVRQHPQAHLLQLSHWGKLKGAFGWDASLVTLTDDAGQIIAGAQILFRRLPLMLGTLAYIPYAPLVDWQNALHVQNLMQRIHHTAQQKGAAFLKIEPGTAVEAAQLTQLGFRLSPQTIQPPSTIIVALADDDTMLQRMNQGTRRNIRKSEKHALIIRQGSRADVDHFNAMLDETGDRKAFGVHAPSYYEKAYDLFVPQGDGVLLMASYEGTDLAGIFAFKTGKQAWYLYGASRDVERQRMASFGVQWAGIQWARDHGCTNYDMVGIPDENEETLEATFQERNDGLWGVYRFKRGWGGQVVRSVGAWDYVYNPLRYRLYHAALALRKQAIS